MDIKLLCEFCDNPANAYSYVKYLCDNCCIKPRLSHRTDDLNDSQLNQEIKDLKIENNSL